MKIPKLPKFALPVALVLGAATVARRLFSFNPTPASTPATPASLAGRRVALVGDSLGVGMGPPLRKLVEAEGAALDVRATVGTTIRQWARNPWLSEVLARKPAVVVVSLGTNDLPLAGDRTEDVKSIVRQVQTAGAELAWVEPPTMPTLPDRGNVRAVLHAAVPAESLFPGPSVAFERAPDQIHATPRGYATLAEAVWSWARRPR